MSVFFCFHDWHCFINLVAKDFDVLLLCVSVFVSFSLSVRMTVDMEAVCHCLVDSCNNVVILVSLHDAV